MVKRPARMDGLARPVGDLTQAPNEVAAARALLVAAVPHAIKALVEIALDPEARDADRIQAAGRILEHSLPKPTDTTSETESMRDLAALLAGGEDVIESEDASEDD